MARSIKKFTPKLSVPRLPDWNSDEPDVFEEMTLQEHLEELRDRIVKSIIVIVPAFLIGFYFSDNILSDITAKSNVERLQILDAVGPITVTFQISLYAAIAITMPFLVYQFMAFLMPGMTRQEKKLVFTSMPFVTILFIAGTAFGYFVAAPRAMKFLSSWNSDVFDFQITAQNALTFFLRLVLGLGIGFQLPVIVFVLSRLGIIRVEQLRRWRKYAYLILMVLAAIITPTPDPLNMAVVAIPLILLYELGILISAIFHRTTKRTTGIDGEERHELAVVDDMDHAIIDVDEEDAPDTVEAPVVNSLSKARVNSNRDRSINPDNV